MKQCNAEIMKTIKLLDQMKQEIIDQEDRVCTTTYQTESDMIVSVYNFTETRNQVIDIDAKIRMLKHLLNYSNATTIVEDSNMTLGECLVYMAQLNNERCILEQFVRREPKSRRSTMNGVIEFTVLNYDKDECKKRLESVQEMIAKLQIAIDRTNLTNMIEIE